MDTEPLRESMSPPNDRSPSPLNRSRSASRDRGGNEPEQGGDRVPGHGAAASAASASADLEADAAAGRGPPSDVPEIEDIRITNQFIDLLKHASLDDGVEGLDPETIELLRHPVEHTLDVDDPDLRLSIDLFLAATTASQATYIATRAAILRRHPESTVLSFDQVKRRIALLSGVYPLVHDMCPKTCIAYTGPFAELESCPKCSQPRYDPITLETSQKKIPRQQFYTLPLGPQLQALWRSPESARNIKYLDHRVKELVQELLHNDGQLETYDDFCTGSDFLDAVLDKKIKSGDMVLLISMDGAQLYRNKTSDCWIYIWVILNHAPDVRYKKKYVLPGGFIPGPDNPKHVDSFLFPGLHHLVAIQNEGLKIWDADLNLTFPSHPFLAIVTADGPGMTYFDGLVGHQGAAGCRVYCGLKGRRKPGAKSYYPARLKPNDYDVEGCNHDDIPFDNISLPSSERYQKNLRLLQRVANSAQYKRTRLATGISKPSIFSGFSPERILGIPACFGSDLMHLISLNIPSLFMDLWRGTMPCDASDDVATWDWAVLQGDTWQTHGQAVADATPYLPGSFDRPPRNPTEKISSGYKAWEFLIYLFALGPALFYGVLPEKYWKNFCRLVWGVRLIHQRSITAQELGWAHKALMEFCEEFELLYYQRRTDRLHFVRPCIHTTSHLAPEVPRLGPGAFSMQWVMERTIGNLGEEIKQPSNPYANLSERGLRRSQINALKAMIPDLEPPDNVLPRGCKDIGGGFVLLRAKDTSLRLVRLPEGQAINAYLEGAGVARANTDMIHVVRWARLRLPNGQIARSAWKEKLKPLEKCRMSRNVKVRLQGALQPEFAEVLFFFEFRVGQEERQLALVSMFTPPDAALLEASVNTLWSCRHQGDLGLRVIDTKYILSVVAMVPHRIALHGVTQDRFFVAEKPGLDVAHMGGTEEEEEEKSDDDDAGE
ncbi:hypothetical protein PLICRDRAFT_564772 [Plicaturopsis crispa FD-325 SS-3]|nr:hypothetical protein PLICRDRAFT_564772 [Plicaturopsis crispa FD-325 SS-3]